MAHDYIFFADDRSSIPTSTMHIADQIASGNIAGVNRVFWVNIYTRLPKVSLHELKKAFSILTRRGARPAVNQQNDGTTIISATPLQFPWFGLPARRFNGYCARRFFQKLVKQYNIQHPVLVTNFPCVVDAFRSIRHVVPHAPQIYYCFDDFVEYPGFNPKHWEVMEQEFFANVDGVVFTSRDLVQNKKRPESLPHLYLPHGVDYEHFASVNSVESSATSVVKLNHRGHGEDTENTENDANLLPLGGIEKIKKPIIGFFGTIDTWVDISAIAYLAKRFPHCSFVLIGRSVVPMTALEGLENVHYLGQVSYSELPQYARYFDVGLIPFEMNDLTKAVNPLKLMEYYALGLPVISTRLPDIIDMPGPLWFADTHEEFGNGLDEILRSDLSDLRRQAREVARQNSWLSRAERFVQFAQNGK